MYGCETLMLNRYW